MTLSPLTPQTAPPNLPQAQSPPNEGKAKTPLPNPGMTEALHKEVREIFPTVSLINGAKVEINKPQSPNFQVGHKFLMGPKNSYSFSPVFANEYGLMMAELDSQGNLSGQIHVSPIKNTALKFHNQFTERGNSAIFDVEHSGQDFTTLARLINPDIATSTGVGVFQYLQSVTHQTALGVEFMVQKGPMGIMESTVSFVGKHAPNDTEVYTGNLAFGGPCQFSYFRRVNQNVSLGAEIETFVNSQQRESMVTLGGKYDVGVGALKFMIDSKARLASLLEYRIFPGFNLHFSGQMDYWNKESKFGFGISLGS